MMIVLDILFSDDTENHPLFLPNLFEMDVTRTEWMNMNNEW